MRGYLRHLFVAEEMLASAWCRCIISAFSSAPARRLAGGSWRGSSTAGARNGSGATTAEPTNDHDAALAHGADRRLQSGAGAAAPVRRDHPDLLLPPDPGAQEELSTTYRTARVDRKSTRLNSSHGYISYAVFCL